MSQTETAKAAAAEDRTETTRSFVRTVKAAAPRKYTPEEKIPTVWLHAAGHLRGRGQQDHYPEPVPQPLGRIGRAATTASRAAGNQLCAQPCAECNQSAGT